MGSLNYNNIDFTEFESLAKDVMEKMLSVRLERFGPGKDGGIDLTDDTVSPSIIVQCKKYSNSSSAVNTLKKEYDKLKKYSNTLKSYYIFTSVSLNNMQIKDLRDCFGELMKSDENIVYNETLEDFFNDQNNKDVLEKHQKLFDSFPDWWKQSYHSTATRELTKPPVQTTLYGRDQELSVLREKIQQNQHLVLVNGLGGIGKSALARNLYKQMRPEFQRIAWINYQDSLKASLNADITDPQFKTYTDPEERFDAIYRFLQEDQKTLIFIDDVTIDSWEDDTLDGLSGYDHITFVLTSRRESIENFESVKIGFLSEEDCVDLFYAHYHRERKPEDVEIVKQIVQRAYCHTLTVELLARAAVRENNLFDYFQRLKENIFDVPKKVKNKTVQEHIQLLYRMADFKEGSEKSRILWNFAIMPTMEIPTDVKKWIGADVNALDELIQAGWIEDHNGSYFMHSLIKEIILLDSVNGKTPANIADKFLQYIEDYAYFYKKQIYTEKQTRYSIVNSVINSVNDSDYEKMDTSYMTLADAAEDLAFYSDAERYYQKSVVIRENVLGLDHPDTGTTYNNLAGLYKAMGQYDQAEQYYLKALAISEKVLGLDHPDTGAIYNNLAVLYKAMGQYDQAEQYSLKALAIREKVLGLDHPDTGATYNNLAGLYQAMGQYDQAEQYYLKALAISEKVLGLDHPSTGTTYNSLAVLYKAMGQYDQAEQYYLKALAIREKVLGLDHPSTGTTYNNLAVLYKAMGQYDQAEQYYLKALAISEKVLGLDHPDTGTTYYNLAGLYAGKKDLKMMIFYLVKALHIWQNSLGANHPNTKMAEKSLNLLKELLNDE